MMCKIIAAALVGMTVITLIDLACHCVPPVYEIEREF
jgi:hypothetical protein